MSPSKLELLSLHVAQRSTSNCGLSGEAQRWIATRYDAEGKPKTKTSPGFSQQIDFGAQFALAVNSCNVAYWTETHEAVHYVLHQGNNF